VPGFTVPLGFPYPLAADPLDSTATNGPRSIQALAEAVDASVTSTTASALQALSPETMKITAGTQPLANNVSTQIAFNTEVFDNDSMVDLVSNPFQAKIVTAGTYIIIGGLTYAPNATGYREVSLTLNAVFIARSREPSSPDALFSTAAVTSCIQRFVVGDKIGVIGQQTSGASLAVTSGHLMLCRVSS
jgi:hypothetical protein